MLINQYTYIYGAKTILAPYEKKHVSKYHEWMKSGELQQLTASEPLSLEEEYGMQESWRKDDNKCTFIILDAVAYDKSGKDEVESMVGDVNLFFNDETDKSSAEVEIMIAEPTARGKGFGKEALLYMLKYGIEQLGVCHFTAKIDYKNEPSLALFNKIGFVEISRSDVFQEITLEILTEFLKNKICENMKET